MNKVDVGITTIIHWVVALAGFTPIIVKLLEGAQSASHLGGVEGASALIGAISLAVAGAGRYWQAAKQAEAPVVLPPDNLPPVGP